MKKIKIFYFLSLFCIHSAYASASENKILGIYNFDRCVLVATITLSSDKLLSNLEMQENGKQGIVWDIQENTEGQMNSVKVKVYSHIYYTLKTFLWTLHSFASGFEMSVDGANILRANFIEFNKTWEACAHDKYGVCANGAKTARYLLDKLQANIVLADIASAASAQNIHVSYILNHDIDVQTQDASFCH